MKNFKESISAFKSRLVHISGEEPLSRLSLVVIIALDLFILFVLFQGLHEHTKQLTSPDEYVPLECREIFITRNWSETNFLTKLQQIVLSEYNNYSFRYEGRLKRADTENMHDSCRTFYTKVKAIAENADLEKLFVSRQDLTKKQEQLAGSLKKLKAIYDTSLLENIARKDTKKENLPAIQSRIASQKKEIEDITRELTDLEMKISSQPAVSELKAMLLPGNVDRKNIIDDFKKFQKFYPLKELGWQLVFLLPLFFVFCLWSSRSVKKGTGVQTLISSHLLVVTTIPIFLKTIDVVLDLIPRHFFKDLFDLLKSFHIIALWHYILIFVSICVALLAVYLIQKKIFNKQRIQQKRLMKGACFSCGKKLPHDMPICPFCGTGQFRPCPACGEKTYVCGSFCMNCGQKL